MRGTIALARWKMHVLGIAAFVFAAFPAASQSYAQDGDVVARVNGHEITAEELAIVEQMYGTQLGQMPEDARRSVLVDVLIELRIVADEARKADIADQDTYRRWLAFFEAQTLRTLFINQQVAAAVTDAAVRAAYDEQSAKVPSVLERRLRHVLLRSESDARDVIAALKSGRSFADLARERSADEISGPQGGDLGFIAEGQTIPELDEAAANLQASEFTEEPVATAFGFHVVLLEEERNRPAPPFETVAAQIRQALEAAEERRILSELRAGAQIEKLVPDVEPPEEEDGHEH